MEYSKKASNCKLLLLDGYYTRADVTKTFEKYGIYGDITKYFESLHTMGDHCIVQDIDDYISSITGNGLGKA